MLDTAHFCGIFYISSSFTPKCTAFLLLLLTFPIHFPIYLTPIPPPINFFTFPRAQKHIRGLVIARLYFNIGEFSAALGYIQDYIAADSRNAKAYKDLGQCYEKLKQPDKQLEAYQCSLELDKKQSDLLIEVCRLLQSADVTADTAKYWYKMAESRGVHDAAVLDLKLKCTSDADGSAEHDIILDEIVRRPHDTALRINLVYSYIKQNQVAKAFAHVYDIEVKAAPNLQHATEPWYVAAAHALDKYKEQTGAGGLQRNWSYWLLVLWTLDRRLQLSLQQASRDDRGATATALLQELDTQLHKAATECTFADAEQHLVGECVAHYRAQLCLHMAAILLKRAVDAGPQANWPDTKRLTLPLLWHACNAGTVNAAAHWTTTASAVAGRLMDHWHNVACFRRVQAVRTLVAYLGLHEPDANAVRIGVADLIGKTRAFVADTQWRKKIYRTVYGTRHTDSYFLHSAELESPVYEWPDPATVERLERDAQKADPSSLAHMVYVALGSAPLQSTPVTVDARIRCDLFNLRFSVSGLSNCKPETLNQLDVESFLYAATIQAKRTLTTDDRLSAALDVDDTRPRLLPFVVIADGLCTDDQLAWWSAAWKVCNNLSGDKLAESRAPLKHGIEAVRGVGSPEMDLIIVLKVCAVFVERGKSSAKAAERNFLADRATNLAKLALNMFRTQNGARAASKPMRRLFKYADGTRYADTLESDTEINSLMEHIIKFVAVRNFKLNAYDECIDDLADIRLPYATYYQATAYREMVDAGDTPRKNRRVYLDKAVDLMKQTRDLLDADVDKNHPLNAVVDEELRRCQAESRKLETSLTMSDSFVSANGRSDLDESAHDTGIERELRHVTDVLLAVRDSVTTLQKDVEFVRKRITYIEDQFTKNESMWANASANTTSTAQPTPSQQQQRNASMMSAPHSPMTAMNNSYGMPPMYYDQYAMNPYQAALMNAAAGVGLGHSPQLRAGLSPNVQSPYGADPLLQQLHHQQLLAQSYAGHPQLYNLLLQNQAAAQQSLAAGAAVPGQFPGQVPAHAMAHSPLANATPAGGVQVPPQQQQSTPVHQQPAKTAKGKPAVSTPLIATTPVAAAAAPVPAPVAVAKQQTPVSTRQFAPNNNRPVERLPPVNVVITSSDPVPARYTQTTSAPDPMAFTVTIPAQHIKSTSAPVTNSTPASSAILAALQDKSTPNKVADPRVSSSTPLITSTPAVQPQKPAFGTLAKPMSSSPFSSTPFASPVAAAAPAKTGSDAAAKPNPFAAFTFGGGAGGATATVAATPPKPFAGFNLLGKTPESIAAAAQPANAAAAEERDEDDHYEPTAHFEPVIALPDLVEVKTGEEDEQTLFEHRAKLLRFVKESKEWKERGLGIMKVMVSNSDPNKVRLLMRREQVFKLCCNQLLSKDTKFNEMPKMKAALSWCGKDYSEEVLTDELFIVRFKLPDTCKQFHDAILAAQAKMSGSAAAPSVVTAAAEKPQGSSGFGDQFKPKAGTWSCKACYTQNGADTLYCACCEAPKDDTVPKKGAAAAAAPTANAAPKFSFGNLAAATAKPAETKPAAPKAAEPKPAAPKAPAATEPPKAGFGDLFKPKAGSWSCKGCYTSNPAETLHCACCEEPKDDTVPKKEKASIFGSTTGGTPAFSFGNLAAATAKPAPAPTAAAAPAADKPFGSAAFSFSLGSTAMQPAAPVTNAPATLESKDFSFVFKSKSPAKPTGPAFEDVSDDEHEDPEKENTTYFAPVIALPDKVEVKTGEENEDVLYSHR